MNAQRIIARLAACGITVTASGNALALTPPDRVTPTHAAFVRQHKAELLAALRSANDPDPLAEQIARLANLDLPAMLEGQLTEPQWDRWGDAVAVLSGQLDSDGKARLAALIGAIDTRWLANRGEARQPLEVSP